MLMTLFHYDYSHAFYSNSLTIDVCNKVYYDCFLSIDVCVLVVMEDAVPTICVEFNSKIILANNKRCKLQIWDTSGQDRFR